MSFCFAFRLSPGYCLLYCCLNVTFSRLFTALRLVKMGSLPLTVRLNNNFEGGTAGVECGAVRYCNKNRCSSCLQGLLMFVQFLVIFPEAA